MARREYSINDGSWIIVSAGKYQSINDYNNLYKYIYSSDYGESWSTSSTYTADYNTMSVDGKTRCKSYHGSSISISTDYGNTYTIPSIPDASLLGACGIVSKKGDRPIITIIGSDTSIYGNYTINNNEISTIQEPLTLSKIGNFPTTLIRCNDYNTFRTSIAYSRDTGKYILYSSLSYISSTFYSYIFFSSNYGATWTNIISTFGGTTTGNNNQGIVGMSGNGKYMMVLYFYNWFFSEDYGATWVNKKTNLGSLYLNTASSFGISNDGEKIFIGIEYDSFFLYSFDKCTTWNSMTLDASNPSGENLSTNVTIDDNGSFAMITIGFTIYNMQLGDSSILSYHKKYEEAAGIYSIVNPQMNEKYSYINRITEQTFTQPTLSANGTLGGSSFAVGGTISNAYRAFDNVSSTYAAGYAASDGTMYLTIYNPNALKVTSIAFTNYSSSSYALKSYKIQVSNDNSTYTDLTGTLTNSNTTAGAIWTCTLSNTSFYNYYRILFLAGYSRYTQRVVQIDLTATYMG